ncbi:MAG: DUF2281 domain-containing protein [Anaerolineae bacterium]|nr:DUF2281 domain-containing protein [Anaerolineae bacterium]
METAAKSLEELVRELPPDMRIEVQEFVESLLEKRGHVPKAELKLDWRGALRELRDQYTAVELEHQALEWWRD